MTNPHYTLGHESANESVPGFLENKKENTMTKLIAALSVVLLMLAVGCSSGEPEASAVDIKATVEPLPTSEVTVKEIEAEKVVEVVVTATPASVPTATPMPPATQTQTPKPLSTGNWYFEEATDPISDAKIFLAGVDGGFDSYGMERQTLIIKCYSQNFTGALPVGNEMNIYWGGDLIWEAVYSADVRIGKLPAQTDTVWLGYPGDANIAGFFLGADGANMNAREYASTHMVGTDTFTVRFNEYYLPDLGKEYSEGLVGMVATFDVTGIEGVLSRLDQECP
jgi:hypothetical protein